MIIPDLKKEEAYWRPRLKLGPEWDITMLYAVDPRNDKGEPVWGRVDRVVYPGRLGGRAKIQIRMPRTPAEIPETLDTIVHEFLHCVQAKAEAEIEDEEEIVHTLSPLLTQLRMNDPTRAESLCKAMTRNKMSATRTKAAKGNMDPATLAALAMEAGAMVNLEGLPPEAKTLLEKLVTALAGGAAPAADAAPEAAPATKEEPAPAPGAPMGAAPSKEDPMYKTILAQLTSDREAAVEGLLDTRPDLTPMQRTRFKAIGVKEGVQVMASDLATLSPPPKPAATVVEKPVVLAKMGEEKPPRTPPASGGKALRTPFRPSGNVQSMMKMRISAEPDDEITVAGCRLHTEAERMETGKLMTMSIWDSLPAIHASMAKRSGKAVAA